MTGLQRIDGTGGGEISSSVTHSSSSPSLASSRSTASNISASVTAPLLSESRSLKTSESVSDVRVLAIDDRLAAEALDALLDVAPRHRRMSAPIDFRNCSAPGPLLFPKQRRLLRLMPRQHCRRRWRPGSSAGGRLPTSLPSPGDRPSDRDMHAAVKRPLFEHQDHVADFRGRLDRLAGALRRCPSQHDQAAQHDSSTAPRDAGAVRPFCRSRNTPRRPRNPKPRPSAPVGRREPATTFEITSSITLPERSTSGIGRPSGEMFSLPGSTPIAGAQRRMQIADADGRSATSVPRAPVLPIAWPPLIPAPPSTADQAIGKWSRPSGLLIFGVRPNSPIQTTSVDSSRPRSRRSSISVDQAGSSDVA